MNRDKIVKFCTEYLEVDRFKDTCTNGLQVEGAENIRKIISGVSLSEQLIKRAIEEKAEMIIVHHSRLGGQIGSPHKIRGIAKRRLKLLLENDINLMGFHIPLDAHPVIGNNISLCNTLEIKNTTEFSIGFIGELSQPMELENFIKLVNSKLNTESFVLPNGPKLVKKVAVIAGGAALKCGQAKELGADTYITGNIDECLFWDTKEDYINFINAGHYNTEKLGVQNLTKMITEKFDVEHKFIDIPCEI